MAFHEVHSPASFLPTTQGSTLTQPPGPWGGDAQGLLTKALLRFDLMYTGSLLGYVWRHPDVDFMSVCIMMLVFMGTFTFIELNKAPISW